MTATAPKGHGALYSRRSAIWQYPNVGFAVYLANIDLRNDVNQGAVQTKTA